MSLLFKCTRRQNLIYIGTSKQIQTKCINDCLDLFHAFQCRGVFLIKKGQGPTVLAVGVGGGCLDIFFSRLSLLFSLSLSLGDGPI